jgi:hypothetical protein
MANSRRKFLITSGLAILSVCLPIARDAVAESGQRQVSVDANKVAIQGYDTVAYFTDGKPTKGRAEFETEWQGARWRFASAAHRDLFTRRPDSYAPRFGGFCAGSIIDGLFVRPDPEAWAIVDGKLYLNGSKQGLVEWKQDAASNITQAQERWNALGQ